MNEWEQRAHYESARANELEEDNNELLAAERERAEKAETERDTSVEYGQSQAEAYNARQSQLTLAEQQRDAAIGALELCEKYDTSPTPDYGQHDRRGVKPPAGQRWKTPREHASDTLTRIREMGKMEGK